MLPVWGRQFHNRPYKEMSSNKPQMRVLQHNRTSGKVLQSKVSGEKKANEAEDAKPQKRIFPGILHIRRFRRTGRRRNGLQVDGTGVKPFEIEGLMCGNKFRVIIDPGSPVSIFAIDELRRIIGRQWVVVRDMIDDVRYVDFNRRPLPLLGYMFVSIQVGKTRMSKARVLVAKKGAKSIIGRDWLTALKYRTEPPITKGENAVNSISRESDESENKLSRDALHLVQEFPNLFKRRGRVNNYKIKIEMKDGTRITQQKGRRIPIQLQDQVDSEITNLLDQGHIERVDTIKDDVFIQPVVITAKKDRSVKIAIDARALNDSIAKDKYQMPNLENLMDTVAEKIDGKEGQVFY